MRKFLIILFFGMSVLPLKAQVNELLSKNQLSADFGSLRNRYVYPMTDIGYCSPLIGSTSLRISARLRSYGTLFFFSKSSYDVTPIAEYFFLRQPRPVYFSAGLGVDVRLRFTNDDRSEAESSAEPLIQLGAHINFKRYSVNVPLWTRFYSNGVSFTALPSVSCRISERFHLILRYEIGYLQVYKMQSHEWRRDCFVGVMYAL